MTPRRVAPAVLLLAVILAPAPAARATALQQQSFGVWKAEDTCAKAAFKKFPDYTADSNRARETFYRRCVDGSQLPPPVNAPEDATAEKPAPSDRR